MLSRSIAAKINRETVVVLGWGRAVLLQFAHPLVAAGSPSTARSTRTWSGT